MTQCPFCDKGWLVVKLEEYTLVVADHTISIPNVKVHHCPNEECGQTYLLSGEEAKIDSYTARSLNKAYTALVKEKALLLQALASAKESLLVVAGKVDRGSQRFILAECCRIEKLLDEKEEKHGNAM